MAMTQQERAANYAAYSALTPEQKKARIQSVTGAIPTTSTNNNVSPTLGMSASSTSTGSTGSIPAPGSQASHQAYINREGNPYGGLSGYVANQQNRYNDAFTSGDQDLINKLNADAQRVGYSFQTPQKTANVTTSGGFMPQDAVTNVRSSSDLNQLAQDNTTQERAALLRSINDRIGNIKNSAQYANQLITDNRVLEDQSLLRNLNPFSGRTGYQLAQVQRGRSIDDTSRAATLENQLNTINQEMTDFDKLTPERQREIYNQLLTMERDFGLNVGQLTGQYGGQQTLAARTADQNYGLNYAGVFGTLPGNSQGASGQSAGAPTTLAAQNQAFNQNMATQQFDFQKDQQEWDNNFKSGQFDWQKAQQTWENAFQEKNFQQSMKDAAASRGVQWAQLSQRDKEFIADQTFREKQFERENKQSGLTQDQVNAYNQLLGSYTGDRDPQEALEFATSPQGKKNALDYGLTEGLYNQLIDTLQSKVPQTVKPTANQVQAEYISNIDQMSADQRMAFFKNEKPNIVADLGLNGYEKLKQQYGIY